MKKQASTDIKTSVMNQIKKGDVQMKPKLYYTLFGILSVIAVALVGTIIAYLSSMMFLWLRIATSDTMAYGARANLEELISSFPWWSFILLPILIFVAVVLVHRHGRMYKHRTYKIVIIIVGLSLVLGLVLSSIGVGGSHVKNPLNKSGQGEGRSWQRNN